MELFWSNQMFLALVWFYLRLYVGKKNTELAISLIGYVSVFNSLYSLISLVVLYFIKTFDSKMISGMEIVGRKKGVGFNGPNSM
jgi:hypothetical protein